MLRVPLLQEGGYGGLCRGCDAALLQVLFVDAVKAMLGDANARGSLPLLAKSLQVRNLPCVENCARSIVYSVCQDLVSSPLTIIIDDDHRQRGSESLPLYAKRLHFPQTAVYR